MAVLDALLKPPRLNAAPASTLTSLLAGMAAPLAPRARTPLRTVAPPKLFEPPDRVTVPVPSQSRPPLPEITPLSSRSPVPTTNRELLSVRALAMLTGAEFRVIRGATPVLLPRRSSGWPASVRPVLKVRAFRTNVPAKLSFDNPLGAALKVMVVFTPEAGTALPG